jgi:hypothetical protein
MKKLLLLLLSGTLAFGLFFNYTPVAKAYSNVHMIDNAVFDNTGSMTAGQIDSFLNGFPSSCISSNHGFTAPYPVDWYTYGANVSAGTVIRRAADIWGINPQVTLATLQKEEQLVNGSQGCATWRFWSAMGYDCPGPVTHSYPATGGSLTCVAHESNVGFSQQVSHGAWQLEFGRYRSEGDGNLNWDGDGAITYYGFMTQGSRARAIGQPVVYYDGNVTLGNGSTFVDNGATASLYSYTPYLNQSFPGIFESFFGAGSTTGASPFPASAIFRSYFPATGEHFYTQNYTEWQNTAKAGAVAEGIAYYEPGSATAVPVYRLIIPNGKHFYTASAAEKNSLISTGLYRLEGVAFYVEPSQLAGTAPVWRMRNDINGDHFYTISVAERDNLLKSPFWHLDGAGWFGY